MEKILVILAKGKLEDVNSITPILFNTIEEAEEYIKKVNNIEAKYWSYAEIVNDRVEIELSRGKFYKD